MILGITGASGFLGRHVVAAAVRRGYEVIAFSRHPSRTIHDCSEVRRFDLDSIPDFRDCEAVIHLAAESPLGIWTPSKKRRIRDSRILGTRKVVEGVKALARPPEVLVSASAIGFYGDAGDAELSEHSPSRKNFLSDVCIAWEKEALAADSICRVVTPRISLVMGKNGGALQAMRPVFKCGLGAIIGSGQQWVSWIHAEDLARMLLFAVENLDMRGPLNASSPYPVRQTEFAGTLGKILHRPVLFRAPAFLLKAVLGDFSLELLDSKRVLPTRALDEKFPFNFPELKDALRDLCQ